MSYLAGVLMYRLLATASIFDNLPSVLRTTKKLLSPQKGGTPMLPDAVSGEGAGAVRGIFQADGCFSNSRPGKLQTADVGFVHQEVICPRICPKCCKPMRRVRPHSDTKAGSLGIGKVPFQEKTDFDSPEDASWHAVDFERVRGGDMRDGKIDFRCLPDLADWVEVSI